MVVTTPFHITRASMQLRIEALFALSYNYRPLAWHLTSYG